MNQPIAAALNKALTLLLLVGSVMTLGGGPAWAAPPGSPWGANYFPNVQLVTQDGNKVRFYDDLIKDKVVAINFIYTRCTESCPAETAALKQIAKALGERMGKDVFFYTISIDGQRDKPEALKEYAQKFKAGPGWTFLTGSKDDVVLLRKKLGLYGGDRPGSKETKLSQHSSSFMLGNEATAQWIKRSPFEDANALARLLGTTMQVTRTPNPNLVTYAQAPQLANPTPGAKLFNSHCSNCHSLGREDGIGPGLAGVTQNRDRAWLARWLKEPDAMIAAKDPIAMGLYHKYDRIPMPNFKLQDGQVQELIRFMESTNKLAQRSP